MPHVRPLEGKLWEMRMKGRDGIGRAIDVGRSGQRLIVLHIFAKKTQKTPRRALTTARARLEEKTGTYHEEEKTGTYHECSGQ